jgi:hypothetical protein
MDGIGDRPLLRDFLPAPDQLVRREDTVKVTLALSPGQRRLLPAAGAAAGGSLPEHDQGAGRRVRQAAWMMPVGRRRRLALGQYRGPR